MRFCVFDYAKKGNNHVLPNPTVFVFHTKHAARYFWKFIVRPSTSVGVFKPNVRRKQTRDRIGAAVPDEDFALRGCRGNQPVYTLFMGIVAAFEYVVRAMRSCPPPDRVGLPVIDLESHESCLKPPTFSRGESRASTRPTRRAGVSRVEPRRITS